MPDPSNLSTEPLMKQRSKPEKKGAKTNMVPSRERKSHQNTVALIVVAFAAGIAVSVGHHFYYYWLNGQAVRNTNRQQWALRFGSAFAFLAKCCFCSSTQIAFTQHLWKILRHKYISIQGIDAAFAATKTLFSFCNLEMISKMKTLALLAIASWCIPLIALIAPATLSVKTASITDEFVTFVPVPTLPQNLQLNLSKPDIYNVSDQALSRWASLATGNSRQADMIFIKDVSPRFAELILATATMGQLFPIHRPVTVGNITYSVDFIAPKLLCEESSASVARNTTIAAIHSLGYLGNETGNYAFSMSGVNFDNLSYQFDNPQFDSDGRIISSEPTMSEQIGYYAIIPFEGVSDEYASNVTGFQDNGFTSGKKNELRVVIAHREPDSKAAVSTFLTCRLWNVTWTVNVTDTNSEQTARVVNTQVLDEVDKWLYSWGIGPNHNRPLELNLNQALYTTYFRGVAKYLLGYIGASKHCGSRKNVVSSSRIQETVLTNSVEYSAMFRTINPWDSRLLQESTRLLKDMIEELSQNVTLNLMTKDFFSTQIERPVSRERSTTIYVYEPRNLLLAYSIATLGSLLIMCIGGHAFWSNGVSYSLTISTIICTTQDPDIKEVVGHRTIGSQPLAEDITKTKLRFGVVRA